MNSLVKILGLMAAAGAAAFGLSKAKKLKKGGELITYRVTNISNPKKTGAGLLGNIVLTLYSKLVNPSDQQFSVRIQSVKLYHNNTEMGYKKPNSDTNTIPPNSEANINPIEMTFPIPTIAQLLPKMVDWDSFKSQLHVRVDLVANGVPMIINEPVVKQES